jgi:hypothetical protein
MVHVDVQYLKYIGSIFYDGGGLIECADVVGLVRPESLCEGCAAGEVVAAGRDCWGRGAQTGAAIGVCSSRIDWFEPANARHDTTCVNQI